METKLNIIPASDVTNTQNILKKIQEDFENNCEIEFKQDLNKFFPFQNLKKSLLFKFKHDYLPKAIKDGISKIEICLPNVCNTGMTPWVRESMQHCGWWHSTMCEELTDCLVKFGYRVSTGPSHTLVVEW